MVAAKKSKTQTKSRVVKAKKPVASKTKKSSQKVDFYPNRMTYAVSAAAGSLLVLIAVMIAYS